MVDDKDKKDLDEDFSALSDALDKNDSAPSLEDLLKDHGIDLGSDDDLDAMQDFSLNEAPSKKQTKQSKKSSEMLFEDFMKDDFSTPSEEDLFGEPPPLPPKKKKESKPVDVSPKEDTSIFEASDFEDSNNEFGDGSHEKFGDDALFDYEPNEHHETSFADLGGADNEVPPSETPPPDKKTRLKKIGSRVMTMVVLVSLIYGGLKLFMGHPKQETLAETPTEIKAHPPLSAPKPTAPSTTTTTTATTTAVPVPTPTVTPTPTPAVSETPSTTVQTTTTAETPTTTLPTPGSVTSSGLPAATPIVTAPENTATTTTAAVAPITSPSTTTTTTVAATPTIAPIPATNSPVSTTTTTTVSEAAPSPEAQIANAPSLTAAQAPVTNTTYVEATPPAGPVSLGNGDVNDKLNNLQLALQSIDQRLAQVNKGGMDEERLERLERLVSSENAPNMQGSLDLAIKKMKELDKKLERINELQHQVRMLNTDIKTLKEDVETQTNIVGEQQRLFNDNKVAEQMQEPGPINMVVQAAIPGRAWLRSERGELLTVIPGDEVPGYGRVVSIDAASGTVVTSSRAVFREQ